MGYTHQDGISVTGSGLAFGPKTLEQRMIDCSGNTTSSLHIQAKSLDNVLRLQSNTGIRMDGGTFSVSGYTKSNHSTALSSILFAMAVPVIPTTGGAVLASGFISQVGVTFSGNQIDFTMFYSNTSAGVIASGGTSSKIAFLCLGT